jgi:hypothetical protein
VTDRPQADTQAMMIRLEVPVDDEWHPIRLPYGAGPHHIACRRADVVEFWTYTLIPIVDDGPAREFRVFGTGQPYSLHEVAYHGTAIAPGGQLVWHLFERIRLAWLAWVVFVVAVAQNVFGLR